MAEYQYINCRNLLPLPNEIESVFSTLGVPPRLYAHSLLVHDVANKLLEKLNGTWKNLNINKDLVLFGAAGHDIGKSVYINELRKKGISTNGKVFAFYGLSVFPKKNHNLPPLTLYGRKAQRLKNSQFHLPIKSGKAAVCRSWKIWQPQKSQP